MSVLFAIMSAIMFSILLAILFSMLLAILIAILFALFIRMLFSSIDPVIGQDTHAGAKTCLFSSHLEFSERLKKWLDHLKEFATMPVAFLISCRPC